MNEIKQLLDNNRKWAAKIEEADPAFFDTLSKQQVPQYLWIGCSDSRVPANQIVDLLPGDIFVHRNVANMVIHTDFNCLSVLQYAVDVLKVKHVIVCGHYGCGGIDAAMSDKPLGLIDNWLGHIRDLYHRHYDDIMSLPEGRRSARLCELNVKEQANNVKRTTIVKDAWARGQALHIHSWIYSLKNGRITDLTESG